MYYQNKVNSWNTASDGSLSLASGSPFATDDTNASYYNAASVIVEPIGNYAYTLNHHDSQVPSYSNTISCFQINSSDGSLALASTPFPLGVNCSQGFYIEPSGEYLYAGRSNLVTIFRINQSSGELTRIDDDHSLGGSSLYAINMLADKDSEYLYIGSTTVVATNNIGYFSINSSNGNLTFQDVYSLSLGATCSNVYDILMDPDEKYLFVSDQFNDRIVFYTVNSSSGSLSRTNEFGTSNSPRYMDIDILGKYIFVSADDSAGQAVIDVFELNDDGSLTNISGSPFSSPATIDDLKVINK
jgi:6-phosphogluconolactonase (cycloisomerase 2 family)